MRVQGKVCCHSTAPNFAFFSDDAQLVAFGGPDALLSGERRADLFPPFSAAAQRLTRAAQVSSELRAGCGVWPLRRGWEAAPHPL